MKRLETIEKDLLIHDYCMSKGRCTLCHRRLAVPGYRLCRECQIKERERMDKYFKGYQHYRERIIKATQACQRRMIEKGLCRTCGKRPIAPGRIRCKECLEKDAAWHRRREAEKRKGYGD